MIDGKRILGLITARGGSKGIPGKNIKPLMGKPLLAWTIEAALAARCLDRLVLSSDSAEIQQVARDYGCEVPFQRPATLASDSAGSIDVVLHALDTLDDSFDLVILLQPTSPFRSGEDIDHFVAFVHQHRADVAVSVSISDKHPMYIYRMIEGRLQAFIPQNRQLRRQDIPSCYVHNGALYAATPEHLRRGGTFNDTGVWGFLLDGPASIDIDTPEDWDYAEYLAGKYFGAIEP